jgi:hypothetical protein
VWTGLQEFGLLEAARRHEAVHAVQSLQFDAVEPSFGFLTNDRIATASPGKRLIRFEHLELGLINVGEEVIESAGDRPWREVEAYKLANDTEF